METICGCFVGPNTDEGVQLQIIKVISRSFQCEHFSFMYAIPYIKRVLRVLLGLTHRHDFATCRNS